MAPTDSTVLILGETGTGKELIARAIHQLSARRDYAFVKLNCAAIPTGPAGERAVRPRDAAPSPAPSRSASAASSWPTAARVFLDEIGEMPLEVQPKLLRVLQEREFERLGSTRTLRSDVRLIAATNRDLARSSTSQQFREDLYYRLNVFPIHAAAAARAPRGHPGAGPPLHAAVLAAHEEGDRDDPRRDDGRADRSYDWPGNIRELQNLIERAVILSRGAVLEVPLVAVGRARRGARSNDAEVTAATPASATLADAERRHILSVLQATGWVVGGADGAAARLGMKRSTLQFRMRKLGIARPRRGVAAVMAS